MAHLAQAGSHSDLLVARNRTSVFGWEHRLAAMLQYVTEKHDTNVIRIRATNKLNS
jgi:hypothetical protein